MLYLILVLIALALLAGFLMLVQYEKKHGIRFLASERNQFDKNIERIEFIVMNVDLSAFVRDEIRHAMTRMGHTVAHLSLQAVRATERLLTRLVRYLRTQHEDEVAPRETAREFVKTLSEFKDGLKATHPDIGVTDTVPVE